MKTITYLAQAYSNDPRAAYNLAIYWTAQLRLEGFTVLSPILHSHPYHTELKESCISDGNPEYRKQCEKLILETDYVQWDLDLLEPYAKLSGCLQILFLPTCFDLKQIHNLRKNQLAKSECILKTFVSNGAKREFEWALQKKKEVVMILPCFSDDDVRDAIRFHLKKEFDIIDAINELN